jgi:predicted ATPase
MYRPSTRTSPGSRNYDLASDHSTPPHVLDEVARQPVVHWHDGVRIVSDSARQQIADHPEVSPDTLSWLLAVSVDETVICNALRHESTPVEILRRYVASQDPEHWNALAQNTGAGEAFICEVVFTHPDRPQVALCALMNPAIGDLTFDRIAAGLGDEWSAVVKGIRTARAGRW